MGATQPLERADPLPNAGPEATWTVPRPSAPLLVFKWLGVGAASVLFATLLARTAQALASVEAALVLLPGLVLGYLCADLLSGTAHWFCDTFFEEDTPLIGAVVIQPFRDHHVFPQRITRYRFIEQDTTNFFLMLIPLGLAEWGKAPQAGEFGAIFWCGCALGLSTGSFCTNLFHKWAHARRPPALARWLQRSGLILSPARHARHHGDYSRGFCVTSGWLNPLLDAVHFFPRVELAVRFFQR